MSMFRRRHDTPDEAPGSEGPPDVSHVRRIARSTEVPVPSPSESDAEAYEDPVDSMEGFEDSEELDEPLPEAGTPLSPAEILRDLQGLLHETTLEAQDARDDAALAREEAEVFHTRAAAAEAQVQEARAAAAAEVQEARDAAEAEAEEARADAHAAQVEADRARVEAEELAAKLEGVSSEVATRGDDAQRQVEALTASVAEKEEILVQARDRVTEWQSAFATMKSRAADEIKDLKARLQEADEARAAAEEAASVEGLHEELAEKDQILVEARSRLEEWQAALEEVRTKAAAELGQRDEKIQDLQAELAQRDEKIEVLSDRLAEQAQALADAVSQLEERQVALEQAKNRAEVELAQRDERGREAEYELTTLKSQAEELERLTEEVADRDRILAETKATIVEWQASVTAVKSKATAELARRDQQARDAAAELARLRARIESGERVPAHGLGQDDDQAAHQLRLAQLQIAALRSDFEAVVERGQRSNAISNPRAGRAA